MAAWSGEGRGEMMRGALNSRPGTSLGGSE